MKLYYKPGACSLASHIALREIGADFGIEKVDTARGVTETGADFRAVNPLGYVPALALADGDVITEGPAILQFIADSAPESGLAPAAGTRARTKLQSLLNFIGTELHGAFGVFFRGAGDEAAKARLNARMDRFDAMLADGRAFLTGETFTVADAYAFVVASWTRPLKIDLSRWPHVAAFVERVAARPAVQAAMKAEGLLG
ncbi:MAG: glutathione transferase GstA [Pikeienuella sp.]